MKKFIFVIMACAMFMIAGCESEPAAEVDTEIEVVEKTPETLADAIPNPDKIFPDATGEKTVVSQDGYFGWRVTEASEDMLDTYIQELKDAGFTKKVIEVGGYGYQAFDETESYVVSVIMTEFSDGYNLIIQGADADDYAKVTSSDMEETA